MRLMISALIQIVALTAEVSDMEQSIVSVMSKDQILVWGQYPLQKGTQTIAITGRIKSNWNA